MQYKLSLFFWLGLVYFVLIRLLRYFIFAKVKARNICIFDKSEFIAVSSKKILEVFQ